jgi:hypothetical protein
MINVQVDSDAEIQIFFYLDKFLISVQIVILVYNYSSQNLNQFYCLA